VRGGRNALQVPACLSRISDRSKRTLPVPFESASASSRMPHPTAACAHVLSDRWMPPDLAASFEPRPVPQTRTSRCSPLGRAQPRRSALSLRSVLWLMALRQAPSTPNWGRSALYTRLGDPRATLGLGRTKTPCQTRPLVLGMAAEEAAERGAGGNIVDDTRAPRSE
jgi:hypothetical protein